MIFENGRRTGFVRVVAGGVWREREERMLVAEVKEGHILPVGPGGYHCDGVLLVEELEYEGEVVRVQQELREVFELENVCSPR